MSHRRRQVGYPCPLRRAQTQGLRKIKKDYLLKVVFFYCPINLIVRSFYSLFYASFAHVQMVGYLDYRPTACKSQADNLRFIVTNPACLDDVVEFR